MTGSIACPSPFYSGGLMSTSAPLLAGGHHHHHYPRSATSATTSAKSELFPSPSELALSAPTHQELIMSFESDAKEEDIPRRHTTVECEEEISRVMNASSRYGSLGGSDLEKNNNCVTKSGDPFALKEWLDGPVTQEGNDTENLADFAFDFDQ